MGFTKLDTYLIRMITNTSMMLDMAQTRFVPIERPAITDEKQLSFDMFTKCRDIQYHKIINAGDGI
jgi:hypothetical protein